MTLDKKEFSDERKTSDVTTKLQTLHKDKFRIIIGDFYQDVANEVLCAAYHQHMTGREVRRWSGGGSRRTVVKKLGIAFITFFLLPFSCLLLYTRFGHTSTIGVLILQ